MMKEKKQISSYLATGDREVCKDAVFLIFMASIGFEALPFTVIPQLQSATILQEKH